ncbi:MAG: VTT domain-containing protein [Bryobacteraceae bacterium]|jgi:membrane protein YqaA with SNARE-associated domain
MSHFWELLKALGPWSLLIVSTIESLGIPNPGGTDWLLVAMAIARPGDAALCAAMAVLGSLIGTAAFFDVMQRGGEKVLARYTSSERGARFRSWFQRYGLVTVFIPALVPLPFLPFKAFAACAGALGVNRWRFLGVLAVGRIIRYSALAYLGVKLGTVENSKAWVKAHTWHMVIFAIAIFLCFYLLLKFLEREPAEQR